MKLFRNLLIGRPRRRNATALNRGNLLLFYGVGGAGAERRGVHRRRRVLARRQRAPRVARVRLRTRCRRVRAPADVRLPRVSSRRPAKRTPPWLPSTRRRRRRCRRRATRRPSPSPRPRAASACPPRRERPPPRAPPPRARAGRRPSPTRLVASSRETRPPRGFCRRVVVVARQPVRFEVVHDAARLAAAASRHMLSSSA